MPEPQPEKPRPWARWFFAGGALLALGLGAFLIFRPDPSVSTTTTIVAGPTTTEPSTTTDSITTTDGTSASTQPPTSTNTTVPVPTTAVYDVVVVGEGLGGATAATSAARMGANVALLSPIGYFGGQAGAAGVSTMDEGSNHFVLRRSGIYGELATYAQAIYGPDFGDCYFIEDSLCPEPVMVDEFLRGIVSNAGVDVIPMTQIDDVLQEGIKVTGVVADASTYFAEVVIDATEFSDLYPMIEGLNYEVGSSNGCVQDTTWLAIRTWLPPSQTSQGPMPPETAAQDLFDIYGPELDSWLDGFRASVVNAPGRAESGPEVLPWDLDTEIRYRALADRRDYSTTNDVPKITRTGANYANDYALTTAAIEDPIEREAQFRRALHKTYAFLWYLRWELGVTDWSVDITQRYFGAQRMLWDDLVPDELEQSLPPIPYVREGRRLIALYNLGPADLSNDVRGRHRFDDSVLLGGYFSDFHGCEEPEAGAGFGLFEIPLRSFVPETIDGFMPGMVRAAGVSRTASSAVRTQPEEMWSGEAIGIVAAIAARDDIEVRQVDPEVVQPLLLANDLIFFLPP